MSAWSQSAGHRGARLRDAKGTLHNGAELRCAECRWCRGHKGAGLRDARGAGHKGAEVRGTECRGAEGAGYRGADLMSDGLRGTESTGFRAHECREVRECRSAGSGVQVSGV